MFALPLINLYDVCLFNHWTIQASLIVLYFSQEKWLCYHIENVNETLLAISMNH